MSELRVRRRHDPPVRGDGKCAVCPKPRPKPQTTYAQRRDFELDPFCSRLCCESFHGLKTARDVPSGVPAEEAEEELGEN